MQFKTADIRGVRIFYREAGDQSKPAIVLLHGFPTSFAPVPRSHSATADQFHVMAPDIRVWV